MRYEDLYKAYAQRYAARLGSGWYLITPTALVALPEPVSGGSVLELTELTDGWTLSKDGDYVLADAQSMALQLYRLPDNLALLHNNLIATRHDGRVRVFWADTKEPIDSDRLLALEEFADKPYRADRSRGRGFAELEQSLRSDWGNQESNRVAELLLRPVAAGRHAELAEDFRRSCQVSGERALFDRLLAARREQSAAARLQDLARSVKAADKTIQQHGTRTAQ